MADNLGAYRYLWPPEKLAKPQWRPIDLGAHGTFLERTLPEQPEELARDSRWPAFFPAPMCLITATDGKRTALEKVVGPSIVNRFPYVIALSFCRQPLSERHHVRNTFMDILETGGSVAVQFLPPGPSLDRAMQSVLEVSEQRSEARLANANLATAPGLTNNSPIFADAYMAYEARLARPTTDFSGNHIFESPWQDVGSHRVCFLEINAIQLRRDIAEDHSRIHWRSLPVWKPGGSTLKRELQPTLKRELQPTLKRELQLKYQKGFTPDYYFPSKQTIGFTGDRIAHGRVVKFLPPLPEDQVEVDNDRARWPCFFPSSAGMITSWADADTPNLMPCGSTTILSRHPLVIGIAVSYAAINERYAPRASLDILRRTGSFGCGVPFIGEQVLAAICYAGNVSLAQDPDKLQHSGLRWHHAPAAPHLTDLPVHFECDIIGEVRLGTHILFLGEAKRILVREDVTPDNPLEWYPWAELTETLQETRCA